MNMHPRHSLVLLISGAVAVAASFSVRAQAASEPPPAKGTGAGKAVVIVSVTHDEETGSKASAAFYIDSRAPNALLNQHVLSSIDKVLGIPRPSDFKELYGRVYVFELPAGIHAVDMWQTSFAWSFMSPVSPPSPLPFEVSDGEVIYLGNLNMVNRLGHPNFLMPWVPVGGTPEVRDRRQVDLPIAETKMPEIKGKIQIRLLPLGTWGPQDPPTQTRHVSPPIVITK